MIMHLLHQVRSAGKLVPESLYRDVQWYFVWLRRSGNVGALDLTGSQEKAGSCQNKMLAL
jgi:hypothetical protein